MKTSGPKHEIQAIQDMYDEAVSHFREGDIEGVLDYWDEDAVYIWPAISPSYGKDAVRAAYEEFFTDWTVEEKYWLHEIEVADDLAYDRFSTDLRLTSTKGEAGNHLNLHGIHVYRRQPDGSWKFKTIIATSVPLDAEHR